LPALLAAVGVVVLALGVAEHPRMQRFAKEARPGVGTVLAAGNRPKGRNYSKVGVDDPELGHLVIDIYGARPIGQHVPVLCRTKDAAACSPRK
jgi:hypothetical protein